MFALKGIAAGRKAASLVIGLAIFAASTAALPAQSKEPAPPYAGANSFTEAQARERIEKTGVSNIVNLKLDQNGIWRGQGQKDGRTVQVALDYRGHVVTQ